MSKRLVFLAGVACMALAGCRVPEDQQCSTDIDGRGSVVVRWRIFDAVSGRQTGCATDRLVVDAVELEVYQVEGPRVPCATCTFPCGLLEGTTFAVPPGRYQLGVAALSCGVRVGYAPPPVVRCLRDGEVTNLNAIQILMPPCEHTRCMDAGADGVCDGGR